jgi:tetratricopeptide (TPR) repeat protein
MKLTTKLTNLGIELSLQDEVPGPLEPAADADQIHPRQYYVYAHLDSSGQIFYVGKGKGKRAWSTDRHPLWVRYVEKHLNGEYQIRILCDNLSIEDVEEVEAEWIAQCSDTVVNWINMGRKTDFDALDRRYKLRTANLNLIQQAKAIEKNDIEKATSMYIQAIGAIQDYAFITYERGIVGQLLEEETAELGVSGEISALNRLTICLIKLGRPAEAAKYTESYLSLYRRDLQFGIAERILKRVDKAIARIQKPNQPLHRTPNNGRL